MNEAIARLPRLDPQYILYLRQAQLAQRTHALHLAHDMFDVFLFLLLDVGYNYTSMFRLTANSRYSKVYITNTIFMCVYVSCSFQQISFNILY